MFYVQFCGKNNKGVSKINSTKFELFVKNKIYKKFKFRSLKWQFRIHIYNDYYP